MYATRGTRFNDSTGDGPSLRGGLKIESPKTREGPRVIIFRPWLEKHGSSDAAAMVHLIKDEKELSRFRSMNSFLAKVSHQVTCIMWGIFEIRIRPCAAVIFYYVCWMGFKSARIFCNKY